MANWQAPLPRDNASEKERGDFAREVWTRIKFSDFDWTPPAVAAGDQVTFVVAEGGDVDTKLAIGLRVGMPVSITAPSSLPNGLIVQGLVTTNDHLDIVIGNSTAGSITPPAGAWAYMGIVT